jgi:hypothetical protein
MELQKIKKKDILSNVKVEDGMFSMTDLWKLADSPKNKRPIDWQEKESTQEFIDAISTTFSSAKKALLKTKRGNGAGTYAHKSIALAYAKYLDPKLHILVNEVFFERIEEEKNPDKIVDRAISTYERKGMSPEWITKRITGKAVRNEFTSSLRRHGVMGDGYKRCTNAMYLELYGKEANQVRQAKGLSEKANIRENMSLLELQSIAFAETLAMDDMERNRRYGNEECAKTANHAARIVRNSLNAHRKNQLSN